jgi:hypothetical protein
MLHVVLYETWRNGETDGIAKIVNGCVFGRKPAQSLLNSLTRDLRDMSKRNTSGIHPLADSLMREMRGSGSDDIPGTPGQGGSYHAGCPIRA